jgi:hypothetical protein
MCNPGHQRTRVGAVAAMFIGSVAVWLAVAAAIVEVEYYDGLSAICNARYFLGRSAFYLFDRGPLMAWVLTPAEAMKDALALDPLDLRADHGTMAVLHVGYLVVVYLALVRHLGQKWSTLVAFVTSVTNYVFWSYAPFVSHDLLAGALLLWMVIWSDEVAQAPRLRTWGLLVAAGTLGPLVKQTFGVFWVAVLAAHVAPTLLRLDGRHRTPARGLGWLAAGAATSGLLVWLTYGLVLADWVPDVPLWLRPYRNLQYLAHVYDGTDVRFPLWIYVRNLWAYGRLTTLLLLPGLALALAGSRLQRRVAFAWIASVVFVHALPLREVRYMGFVAPLSAFLIAPVALHLGRHRAALLAMGALLTLDLAGGLTEAARVAMPFYRHSELGRLLDSLPPRGAHRRPLYHNVVMLSFVAPGQSPLAGDRYHRVFHVGAHHVGILRGYAPSEVRPVLPAQLRTLAAAAPEGSALLFANAILAHGPTWVPAPPVGSEGFVQGLAILQTIVLARGEGETYQTPAGKVVRVSVGRDDARAVLVIDPADVADMPLGALLPVGIVDGAKAFPLWRRPDGRLALPLPPPAGATTPERLALRWFAVQRRSPPASVRTR